MALDALKPTLWSDALLRLLNKKLVYAQVCNRDYEGEITRYGQTVVISEIGDIAVNNYNSTSVTSLTVQQLDIASKLLHIDRAKYSAFWIDDQDIAQAKGNVLARALEKQAQEMADEIDVYIASLYGQAGITITGVIGSGTDVSSTNVLKYISLIVQKLDEANVPREGRWIVVPPWFEQKMLMAKIALDTSNSAILGNGALGSFMGLNVYVSNNVKHQSSTDRASVMAGFRDTISLAVQVTKTGVQPSHLIGFKTLVKSLMVYGCKVIRPDTLAVAWVDYKAESS